MKFIFVCFLVLFSAAASQAAVSASDLAVAVANAKAFLCEKSLCLTKEIPISVEPLMGYYGFYHRFAKTISISTEDDTVSVHTDLVHELTHAYRHQFNDHEEIWLDEGLSKLTEYLYSHTWPDIYQQRQLLHPEILIGNDQQGYQKNGTGYSSAFWLTLYLYNHYGGDKFLVKVMRSQKTGWDNILTAAQELRATGDISETADLLTRNAILKDFAVAMLINDEYSASYALHHLDSRYVPLSEVSFSEPGDLMPVANNIVSVFYSRHFHASNAQQVYAVYSTSPLRMSLVTSAEETAEFFIYIF